MAGDSNAGKAGVVLGGTALVAAALALMRNKVAQAQSGALVLDNETMQLLMAMAATSADIEELLKQLLGQGEPGQNIQVAGYPPNANTIIATRIQIAALNTAYQLPDIAVPDDMYLQLKGWPANLGLIYVGADAATCVNINQVWPLLPNEAKGYKIKNASVLWISGTAVGDWCVVSVEQRK